MSADRFLWRPAPDALEQTNVGRWMRRLGHATREEFLDWSVRQNEAFWDALVREVNIHWRAPYRQVRDASRGPEWCRWFVGGQLNIAENCVDRHAAADPTRVALIAEAEDGSNTTLTYGELADAVNRLANALDGLGLQPGDRVALCLPMGVDAAVALYACLKRGLVAVPIFSGFGAGAIATRLLDAGARVVLTADVVQRRGKRIPLKAKLDEALESGNAVEHVVVRRTTDAAIPWHNSRDHDWTALVRAASPTAESLAVDAEHPALLLYTSGTTGRPKGTIHTHAGSLAQIAKEIWLAFDHQPGDRFWWLSDIGWMMGPWTLIGNHHFGGTVFLYDGAPDFPDARRLWEMAERHAITTFGVSPTAVRLLMRKEPDGPRRHDLSRLRLLGSTGEPWDDVSYRWFFDQVGGGRCPVINISGGTEIVGCFLFPLPIQPLTSCTLGAPAPGMAVSVVDEQGRPVRGRTGYLVCTQPAPSMTRGIWNDPQRYLDTYWAQFPGWWSHGDWASVDEDGLWYLHGRSDDALNVAGRKVGPAEVETALTEHPAISEAAVIGVPDDLTGEAIVAFVVARAGQAVTPDEATQHLIHYLGPTFRPRAVLCVPELPKTQSGKVIRRLLRQRFLGEELGDLSTVANPESLDRI